MRVVAFEISRAGTGGTGGMAGTGGTGGIAGETPRSVVAEEAVEPARREGWRKPVLLVEGRFEGRAGPAMVVNLAMGRGCRIERYR